MDASGAQIAANALDGAELFALQDRVADSVVKDLSLRRIARRTPTPSGLDTPALQERYLAAVGLLQRYDRRENVEKALAILQKLADEKPNSALVQAALARADLAMLEITSERVWAARALAATDAARALDPALPEVDVTVGKALIETGRAQEAVLAFRRALAVRPGDVEALLGLGRAAALVGDQKASEAALLRAAELQPSFMVLNDVGSQRYNQGRYGEAVDMFRRASKAAPDSSWAMSNLGGAEVMRCNFSAALDAYRKALALDPKNPSAASNLGLTLLWSGRAAEAAAPLELAATEAPSDYRIFGNLGDAYRQIPDSEAKSKSAYARSIELAREQLALNPKDAEALAYVATGLARTGRVAEARAPMEQSLALDAKDPTALADAAIIAALAGRDAEAIARGRQAIEAGYCREVLAAQPEFARLRANPEFRAIVAAPQKAAGS